MWINDQVTYTPTTVTVTRGKPKRATVKSVESTAHSSWHSMTAPSSACRQLFALSTGLRIED
jgi:hypothetical protein